MQKKNIVRAVTAIGMAVILATTSGCASTMKAIDNRELTAGVKASNSIILNPETLAENRTVFIRYTNTSGSQDIELQRLLTEKMQAKGYNVTANPKEAGYFITANLLYMGKQKDGISAESMLAGGFGGGLIGTAIGAYNSNRAGNIVGAGLAGAAIGVAGEAIVGSMFKVEQILGTVDLQVMEPVQGGVEYSQTNSDASSTDVAAASLGNMKLEKGASGTKTYTGLKSTRIEHKCRLVAVAQQTNMDEAQVVRMLSDQLASQIIGVF